MATLVLHMAGDSGRTLTARNLTERAAKEAAAALTRGKWIDLQPDGASDKTLFTVNPRHVAYTEIRP